MLPRTDRSMPLVAITGATGEVGRGVVPLLERDFTLRLFAIDPQWPAWVPAAAAYMPGDILDRPALEQAMRGADAVLHLAVATGHSGTFEDDAFNDRRFDVNVKGTHHVFETARRLGIRRVVHVSSVMVTWGHAQTAGAGPGSVAGDAPPRPVGTYALTKALGEEVAHHYADQFGMEVIVLRIAAPFDPEEAKAAGRSIRPQQIAYVDLAQAFAKALTVPLSGHRVATIAGHSRRSRWSLEAARAVLGYEPSICNDDLGVLLAEPFDVPGL